MSEKFNRIKSFVFLLLLLLISAAPVFADISIATYNVEGRNVEAAEGEILVKFRDGLSRKDIESLVSGTGAQIIDRSPATGMKRIKLPSAKPFEETLKEYKNMDEVEYAEPNGIVRHFSARPSHLPGQYNSVNEMEEAQWGLVKIRAHSAWNSETGSKDVVVAVLDTGVDYNHPDLVPNMWQDAQGNFGYDFVNDNSDPMDDHMHGTHVAGIIAGASSTKGIVGVSWSSRIMAVKVLAASGAGTSWDVASGINYAADNGADIINMSLGGYYKSITEERAVNRAHRRGVLVISASGNGGFDFISYPAGYDNSMAVGASDQNDRRAPFSDYSDDLDLVAPGIWILSAVPGGAHVEASGTSMAAPFAAGTAALVISRFKRKSISWSPDDIRTILNSSALTLSADRETTGNGRLDANDALRVARNFETRTVMVYPNPYDPGYDGDISIKLDADEEEYFESYRIFSLEGRLVRKEDGFSGTVVSWDGKNDDNSHVAPGLYFIAAEMESGKTAKGKITVLRRR